jgi:Family of unknown function (DUF6221)
VNELLEFLLARLAEDEQAARVASPAPWVIADPEGAGPYAVRAAYVDGRSVWSYAAFHITLMDAAHITRHDPRRVLDDCAAKRRIVTHEAGATGGPGYYARVLAATYADHQDYRPSWRP